MLFADKSDQNLRACVKMVEAVLNELGHSAKDSRLPGDAQGVVTPGAISAGWAVRKGSIDVKITLSAREGENFIRVWSTIALVPQGQSDRVRMLEHLLELNADAVRGTAFALRGEAILLTSERPTIDLDRSEVLDMIRRVELYADRYDDDLVLSFAARRPG